MPATEEGRGEGEGHTAPGRQPLAVSDSLIRFVDHSSWCHLSIESLSIHCIARQTLGKAKKRVGLPLTEAGFADYRARSASRRTSGLLCTFADVFGENTLWVHFIDNTTALEGR